MESSEPRKAGIGAYVALIFAIIFFSGISVSQPVKDMGTAFAGTLNGWFAKPDERDPTKTVNFVEPKRIHDILSVFDFNTLNGKFGSVIVPDGKGAMSVEDSKDESGKTALGKGNFSGKEGSGARDGFLFALTLVPTTLFALGMIAVLEHYGALEAIRRIFQMILRPLMGVPGYVGLAMIASFQTTDAGAAMTRSLHDEKQLTDKERDIFAMFQFSAGATLGNFLGSGAGLLALTAASGEKVPASIGLCLAVMIVFKFFGANLMRLYLTLTSRREQQEGEPS